MTKNSQPPTDIETQDRAFMGLALGLAARGLGATWPNPAVGCVIVGSGEIIGRGWTQPGGRPHAETEALARAGQAGKEVRGATAYVTLEPCAHQGETGPCADALGEAGIARVVVAIADPDPRVDGGGLAILRKAGVEVVTGVCAAEAEEGLAGYLMRCRHGRPLVTFKVATSLDGRIAAHGGDSKWITGEPARRQAHMMRAQVDAVMVGANTVAVDDPALTCRLPGLEDRTPVAVIADGHLRLPLTARLLQQANQRPLWIVALADADPARLKAVKECGAQVIETPAGADGHPDLELALKEMGRRGITSLMVEGGGHIAASLLRAGLMDRIAWFRAPVVLGGDGVPAFAPLGIDRVESAPRFERLSVREFGDDLLETYVVRA